MKRQFFAVLLAGIFLLLTGCGAEKAVPPVSLPETETLPALSAPAVVTEGQPPEEDYDLPGEVMSLVQWHERAAPMALLAPVSYTHLSTPSWTAGTSLPPPVPTLWPRRWKSAGKWALARSPR